MGALRYKSEFQSLAGRRYVVNIWDDEHEGSVSEFCLGPEGFELSYEGSTEDMFKAFIPSRLEFIFNVEDVNADTFIYQVATAEPSRFKIFVTDSPASGDGTENLFWQGFVQGEGINIADEYYPYEVKLAAGDIGFFKDLEFTDSGNPASGYYTAVEVLQQVLTIAGHDEFYAAHGFDDILETSVEWRGAVMASAGDPMDLTRIDGNTYFTYIDNTTFTYNNCQQVVEDLARLFGARFFQSQGKFRLSQIDNLVEDDQDIYTYTISANSGSGTRDARKTIDRIELFETAGGAWSFVPGVKYAEREYKFRRNYLEGLQANSATAERFIKRIPNFSFVAFTEVPRYTLKFTIKYRIKEYDGSSMQSPFNGTALQRYATPKSGQINTYNLVPLWRMTFKGTSPTDNYDYHYTHAAAEIPAGIRLGGITNFKKLIGSKKEWPLILYQIPGWRRADVWDEEFLYFEIIDEEDYEIPITEYFDGDYLPTERTINVELQLTPLALMNAGLEDITFKLELHDVWNRYYQRSVIDMSQTFEDIEWSVDDFELIAHGNLIEQNPETGRKYRVTSPDNYRKKEEMDASSLIALNKKTWHSVEVYTNTAAWVDGLAWKRGTEDARLLNYLSIQQQVAMNRSGLRLYQGGLISTSENVPYYYNTLVKGSIRYMMLQGTFVPRFDEWRNLQVLQLLRDIDGLAYQELKSAEYQSKSSSLPGGNYTPSSLSSDSEGGGYYAPQYEFASAQNGSTYEVLGFALDNASGLDASGVNTLLMVYQDATKLNYPIGYTIDFATNELTFTYPLEDAVLELYYYG